jgi:hypothetical protein
MPTGTGGTIVDGLYYLTAKVGYDGGCSPGTDRGTIDISGGATLFRFNGGTGPGSIGFQVSSGANITGTPLCVTGASPVSLTYTATATTITFFDASKQSQTTFTLASAVPTCNSIANIGTDVPFTADPGAPPTMTGGTIADGTWVRTADIQYNSSTAPSGTRRDTVQVSGTTFQIVLRQDASADMHVTATAALSNNDFALTWTCGNTGGVSRKYTATSTTLSLLDESNSRLEVFTKQ